MRLCTSPAQGTAHDALRRHIVRKTVVFRTIYCTFARPRPSIPAQHRPADGEQAAVAEEVGGKTVREQRLEGRVADVEAARVGPEGGQDAAASVGQKTAPAHRAP